MRCLGYLGAFGPMVAALNDPNQKLVWPDYIAQLQAALWRGPETASQVRLAMEKTYEAETPGLIRMLWGFTEEGLRTGEADMLVGYLDHQILPYRVLAFWNLHRLTGLRLYYRPELPEAKRRQSIQKWRQRIKSDGLWDKSPRTKPRESKEVPPPQEPGEAVTPPMG